MRSIRIGICLSVLLLTASTLHAATRTWTGTNGGSWSDAANWGGTAPIAGDDLVFPAGAPNTTNSNDFSSGTAFHSISVAGGRYSLAGNQIALGGGGITASSEATIAFPIRLDTAQQWTVTAGLLTITGAVDLNGSALTLHANGGNGFLNGIVSGSGSIIKSGGTYGGADWALGGANTFTGPVIVNGGRILLKNPAALGVGDNTVANGTVVNSGGGLFVDNVSIANEHIAIFGIGNRDIPITALGSSGPNASLAGTLVLNDACVALVNGTLTISSSITGPGSIAPSEGRLRLTGPGTFTGTVLLGLDQSTLVIDGGSITADVKVLQTSGFEISHNGAAGAVTVEQGGFTVGPGGGSIRDLNLTSVFSEPRGSCRSYEAGTLRVTGTVAIGWYWQLYPSGPPTDSPAGTEIVLIDNDGADSIKGIFMLPWNPMEGPRQYAGEGYRFRSGHTIYRLSYAGGTGNDLTITSLGPSVPTTTTLACIPPASTAGQLVTLQTTVTSASGTPAGTVDLYDKDVRFMRDVPLDASGVASYKTSLSAGTHVFNARFMGSLTHEESWSTTIVHVVNVGVPSSIAIASSVNPSLPGQSVVFTATVTSGTGTPSETVTFSDGSTAIGTATLDASGIATFSTTTLSNGTHTITAYYGGDGIHKPIATSLMQVVQQSAAIPALDWLVLAALGIVLALIALFRVSR